MSNKFDEDQWVAGQIALDGRICVEFEALEAGYATAERTEQLDDWRKAVEGNVTALRAQIARVTHAERRKHWESELARLGFKAKRAKAPPAESISTETGPTSTDAAAVSNDGGAMTTSG